MIYGHVPRWMALENPEFDEAVTRDYSLRGGKRNAAAVGEITYWILAEELLNRHPDPLQWSPDQMRFFRPLLARIKTQVRQVREATCAKDSEYFRRLSEVMKLVGKREHEIKPLEYVFEAYFFLRKRDGQGSPLPSKTEVRQTAILIRSFYDCNLQHKLSRHLWGKSELTEPELSRIEKRRRWHGRDGTGRLWAQYFRCAGLAGLSQKRSS